MWNSGGMQYISRFEHTYALIMGRKRVLNRACSVGIEVANIEISSVSKLIFFHL